MTTVTPNLDDCEDQTIGANAVWSVSSAKPGFGVEQLRDDDVQTFWQSDGQQPHFVNIQFNRRVSLTHIAFYVDVDIDESYTPSKVAIKCGTNFHDLEQFKVEEVLEAKGWVKIPLLREDENDKHGIPLRANLIQLVILANNENGRDCHIRQIKIFGPRITIVEAMGLPDFTHYENYKYGLIR